jgi:hypothetical protein
VQNGIGINAVKPLNRVFDMLVIACGKKVAGFKGMGDPQFGLVNKLG